MYLADGKSWQLNTHGAARAAAELQCITGVAMEHPRAAGASSVRQWSITEHCRCYDGALPGRQSIIDAAMEHPGALSVLLWSIFGPPEHHRCCNGASRSAAGVTMEHRRAAGASSVM